MVVPLASYWSHPTIFEAIRPHLFAFPHVYQWTTYPITSLLERIWEHFLPFVELCSVLERALAYAHTGNSKVIATSLMRPLWLVKSLLEQGLPTFAPSVRFSHTPCVPVAISPSEWPTLTNMNYGNDHFEACIVSFRLCPVVN
ncbi:uncharacterized protein BJ212DRAFT_1327078 [Suillus subaureus]|uniref:Uncharacterized protein n=1 Tax=Suillus subaureus TaxID=48587 RepID=A0A9P7EL33_9AGAM|nr:uncharacterized protein BJ212DRAFT_1327078 [Suillus subaureus]KAG1823912.1 hypothetical protein BJ212DRAFT_1327078 [Suillus subaureus]